VFGLFFFSASLKDSRYWHGSTLPVVPLLASSLTQAYTWALLTPIVWWFGRRFPFAETHHAVHGVAHVLLSVLCALFAAVFDCAVAPHPGVMRGDIFRLHSFVQVLTFPGGFHQGVVAYWIVFGLQYTATYFRMHREREQRALQLEVDGAVLRAQLAGAELSSVRRQLQPQLLYHTLETTAVLVHHRERQRAEDVLTALGDLLRCVLEDADSRIVPLSRELEHVRAYLALEQLRLKGRVSAQILADPTTLGAAVISGSIQPIVQDALDLILAESMAVSLTIRSARVRDMLKVEIECSVCWQHTEARSQDLETILHGTRVRLQQLHGHLFRLRVFDRDEVTVVKLLLPYETVAAHQRSVSLELPLFGPALS
jgi:hypothetical protein